MGLQLRVGTGGAVGDLAEVGGVGGSDGLAIELAMWFYNVVMGWRGPCLASVTAGA